MSDARASINNSPSRVKDRFNELRMTPDGALYRADLGLSVGLEGRIFGMNAGLVTTPLTTAATSVIANTIPHAWVRVPDGTVIVPLYAKITIESSGATTQGEAAILIAQNDIGNGTSSAADAGPVALNTAVPVVSSCTARQLATVAATVPTNPLELQRFSWAASAANTSFEWNPVNTGVYPMVRGAGSWAIYLGGNAVIYYAQMVWMEFSETGYS